MKHIILAFFLLTASNPLLGQNAKGLDPHKAISQYTFKTWLVEDGLPAIGITDIHQSNDRYIWVGTYNGLARFDGVSFTIYNLENTPELGANSVRVLLDTRQGLFIGTQKGLARYANQRFIADAAFSELASTGVEALLEDEKGLLWIGTTSMGVFVYDGRKLRPIGQDFLGQSPITSMIQDEEKTIWLGNDKGALFKYDNGTFSKVMDPAQTTGINELAQDRHGHIWVASNAGVFTIRQGVPQLDGNLPLQDVQGIVEDSHGHIWVSNGQGLFRYRPEEHRLEHFSEAQGLPNNIIREMLFDHEGNLWVASYRAGLFLLTDGVFNCYTTNEGLSANVVTSIIEYADSTYWISTEGGELCVLERGNIRTVKTSSPLLSPRVKHLMKDWAGNIWISTYGGLMKIDPKGKVLKTYKDEEVDIYARQTLEDRNGNIWVATRRKGVILLKNGVPAKAFNTQNGLLSDFVMSIDEMSNGDIWVGSKDGISIISNEQLSGKIQVADGLSGNLVFEVHEDAEGIVWVATNLGLNRIEKGKPIVGMGNAQGLADDVVFDIVEDQFGYLWLSSNSGVTRVSKAEIAQLANGEIKRIHARLYDRADGMKSEECVGAAKMLYDSHKNIWIPTVKGTAMISPASLKNEQKRFPSIIERIVSNDSIFQLSLGEISIPPGYKRISIDYTAFDYVAPDKIVFKYRLLPFEQEWQEAGKKRNATYTNLPPDEYTFELMAGNLESGIDPEIRRVTFRNEGFFYQSAWFQIGAVLTALLATFIGYTWRIQAIRANEEALQRKVAERTREVVEQKDRIEEQRRTVEKALQDLQEAQTLLVQSEKMASLGQLTAGIAHEINNPINFVYAGANSLRIQLDDLFEIVQKYEEFDALSPEGHEGMAKLQAEISKLKRILDYGMVKEDIYALLNDITNGAERTTEIVKSLRSFTRGEHAPFGDADLHEILDSSLILLKASYKGRIEIVKDYGKGIPFIKCHSGKLGQVFSNIIGNATQAIEGEGRIHISTKNVEARQIESLQDRRPDRKYVEVLIRDTGGGIPPQSLSKIFDPFFTTKEVNKGTGLGLSISYGIIQQHQGHVEARNVTIDGQKGAEFAIYLPFEPEA